MNLLLISTNRSQLPMPVMPIGACIIAHVAEDAGHRVHFLDLMFSRDPSAAIASAVTAVNPDVVGLSVRNIDNVDMSDPVFFLNDLPDLVKAVRAASDAPIILGGAALGIMPEQILRLVPEAYAFVGAGETDFLRVLEHLARGERCRDVPGIAYLEAGALRWNRSASPGFSPACPTPDYRRWLNLPAYRTRQATVPIQTKTGCSFQCVYCTYPRIEGSMCRLKDPAGIAAAVARFAAAGLRDIEFVDSVFNVPREHALEVCRALARVKHGARLQCLELNPRDFDDELLTAMEEAGFVGMGMTLESAADPVLRGLGKGFTSREVHHAAAVVSRHRLPCTWIFLLGGPGETPETVRETLRFAREQIRPRDVAFFNIGLRIYPETELETLARQQGLLTRSPAEMLAPVFYVSPEVDARWIERELKEAMRSRMNFIDMAALGHSFLPTVTRLGARFGLRPPFWRHTRIIRRLLRLGGMDV